MNDDISSLLIVLRERLHLAGLAVLINKLGAIC